MFEIPKLAADQKPVPAFDGTNRYWTKVEGGKIYECVCPVKPGPHNRWFYLGYAPVWLPPWIPGAGGKWLVGNDGRRWMKYIHFSNMRRGDSTVALTVKVQNEMGIPQPLWVQFPDPREDGLCATYPTLDGGFYISLEAARKTKR